LLKHSHNCHQLHSYLISIQMEYNNSLGYVLNKVNHQHNEKLYNMKLAEQKKKELIELYNNANSSKRSKVLCN
jgi:hypothetical protein